MDLDKATEKVKKVENFIQAIWGLLARNWGKLIVLTLLTILGWFCYEVYEEMDAPDEEYYEDEYYDEYE